jgi:anti-sigma-K factor RskA|tara:strand:- start:5 stop:214 length:210 start_codon:yes stop_codon:yes gene_type:complete
MMEMEMEELATQIKEAEQHLAELRKEYRERKTAGLRAAIEARNEADKVLREELRVLGYRTPFTMWRDIA